MHSHSHDPQIIINKSQVNGGTMPLGGPSLAYQYPIAMSHHPEYRTCNPMLIPMMDQQPPHILNTSATPQNPMMFYPQPQTAQAHT